MTSLPDRPATALLVVDVQRDVVAEVDVRRDARAGDTATAGEQP